MAVPGALTPALKKVVLDLEGDLRARVEQDGATRGAWQREHAAAVSRERTAMSWQEWRDDRVTQAAVAWVLTTVFVRFCEDNRLLRPVWIAGPADRRQEALDAELDYFRTHPEHTHREWLLQAVEHLRATRATRELVESHSPLWTVAPSGQAAKRLVEFWREKAADSEAGESLVWDFADESLSTRFLGDLYQDLSDYAKKTFALLQTPEFVEEFILDQTMEPALKERSLDGFTLIDPTCGSGHFLLGAFARLVERWDKEAPGLEVQARAQKALDAIHGVDLNPFAVAIARFRLMVAALQACKLKSLDDAPAFTFHLAAGDSLLHGAHQMTIDDLGVDTGVGGFAYATEDRGALEKILVIGGYDVVVGNPPYITVKDKKLNAAYRELYSACKGTYALTVPFMQRFFELARPASGDRPAGWTGQITSNSFMKREFGSKLIEGFLPYCDLRIVIDSEGAWIPGHNTDGTPTVVLVGRPGPPVERAVRAVLSKGKRETRPAGDATSGPYWAAIVEHLSQPGYDDEYISVVDVARDVLSKHPWSLSGGGVPDLVVAIESKTSPLHERLTTPIGGSIRAGADEAFVRPVTWRPANKELQERLRPLVLGDIVRDWNIAVHERIYFPYTYGDGKPYGGALVEELWPWRATLAERSTFQGKIADAGLSWWEYMQFTRGTYRTPLSISFAFVATHNHFVLDRGGKVFKQSAPVIKLPEGATEDDHLALLGVLNSSTACFWLKQRIQPKGGAAELAFLRTFEFTGSTLQEFPLPSDLSVGWARSLDAAARSSAEAFEGVLGTEAGPPSSAALEELRAETEEIRARMIAEQEELDWEVYRLYGLISDDLTYAGDDLPALSLGERAFEIALACKVAAGEESTAWFSRHGSTPITEIPSHWPQAYRELVQRRLDLIASDKFINLLERPEYKRRWASESWEKRVEKALRAWLLDRLEDKKFWFDAQGRPTARSVAQLADLVGRDAELTSVLELWSGRKDLSVVRQLEDLLADESVPFLAALRLKDTGLRKREAWEHTWDLQRKEDRGEKVGTIPVPPKYTSADFRKQSWWQHRGKLDVPKERFILYPDAGRETDPTPLLGWAGWDHAEQALALAAVIQARVDEGWPDARLVPLVAGLAELQPWVRQWHDQTDPTYQLNLADYLDEELRNRAAQVGHTLEELHAWRPAPPTRGRTRRAQ